MADQNFLFEILMEGADIVKSALEAIGDAGSTAFQKLKDTVDSVQIGENVSAGVQAATQATEALGAAAAAAAPAAQQLGASLADVEKAAHGFGTAIADFGGAAETFATRVSIVAAAASAAVFGIVELTKHAAASVLEMQRTAQAIGTTAEAWEKFTFGAEQAGVAAGAVRRAMTQLSGEIEKTVNAAAGASTKLGDLGISVTRTGSESTDAVAVFTQIADKFQRMEDGAKKTALAIEIFGRRIGPQLIPFLNQGSEGIAKMNAEAERLGLTFTKAEQKIALDVTIAFGKLGSVIEATTQHFALLFGPAVRDGVNALTEVIVANKDVFLAWGREVAQVAGQVAKDIANALSGKDEKVENGWIITLRDTLLSVATLVTTVLLPAFQAVRAGAQILADGINSVFGTKITGDALLFVGVLLRVLGVFNLLGSAIGILVTGLNLLRVAISAFGGVAALANPVLLVILALGVALLLIVTYWDDIKAAATVVFDTLQQGVTKAKQLFTEWVSTPLANAWAWIAEKFNAVVELLNLAVDFVKAKFNEWIATPIANAWTWIKETFDAAIVLLQAALEIAKQFVIDWVVTPVANAWNWLAQKFDDAAALVKEKALALWEWVKNLFSGDLGAGAAVESAAANAAAVSGTGTSAISQATRIARTQDSAMSALAAAAGSLAESLARTAFPGAGGGATPALAAASAGARQVDLNFGDASFRVTAPEAVVSALAQYAVRKKRSSLGNAPSSVG